MEDTADDLRFLVIEGTVRNQRKSIHPARYVTRLLNDRGHDAELFDMKERDIPLMETRRYKDPGEVPPDVEAFGQKVEDADSLVIVAPEYNHSIPGALKNLLDYLYPEYDDKPFSYVTVSGGPFGGVRAHQDLIKITVELGGHPGPDLPIVRVTHVFDENGELVDDDYAERFDDFVDDVIAHAERFR